MRQDEFRIRPARCLSLRFSNRNQSAGEPKFQLARRGQCQFRFAGHQPRRTLLSPTAVSPRIWFRWIPITWRTCSFTMPPATHLSREFERGGQCIRRRPLAQAGLQRRQPDALFPKAGPRTCPAMISTATAIFTRSTSRWRCRVPAAVVRPVPPPALCATDSRRHFRLQSGHPLAPGFGESYQVQFKTNLTDSVWLNLPGVAAFIGANGYFGDPSPAPGNGFYRIVLTP